YHATLISYLVTDMTLDQFNVDYNEFKKMNEEIFIPNGRVLLLENIDWNQIESNDVLEIYFK
ncbi:MAG: hypothetical protein Q4P31_03485, partial [Andreesenia angusta]|nr:hypothetical protein [Andreesenia angusta]